MNPNTLTKSRIPFLSRISLSGWIILGLGAGVFTGLFFGESADALQPIADIYIRLMQMTVLPYLMMALIVGFGQLQAQHAKRLALRGGALVLLTCLIAFAVIVVMSLTFPKIQSASFFSHSLVEPNQPFSIPDLYFTSNPFYSLSNNIVPAVVLFSTMIGIGLIGLENRERVLNSLRVLNASIVAITRFIIRLTPIGVFAIGAVTAGTMTPQTLQRLEVYFVAFAAAALLLGFWILPLLVTSMTPFRYGDVVGIARDALLTAFVTNNAFIVLPVLAERSKALMQKRGLLNQESDSATEVLLPILFNFPNAGRLLTLLFIPFASWLIGEALSANNYLILFAVGIPSYFAKAQVALPFLMDQFRIPHDLFQLYVPTTIITGKFDSMVTAMNLLVFALLGAASAGGFLELQRKRLLRACFWIVAGTALTAFGVQLLFNVSIDKTYHMDEALRRMREPRNISYISTGRHSGSAPNENGVENESTLSRIRQRGTLRVGYDANNPPFSFFNLDDELVGYDIELASDLADALGVKAEFIPVSWTEVPARLSDNFIDVMPSVWYRPYWFSSVRLSEPYMTGTVGLVVRDDRRLEFASIESLRSSSGLKIGVPLDSSQLKYSMKYYFGNADVKFMPTESASLFFEGKLTALDGFLMPAENGAAASLLHPEFTVVVPQPDPVKIPFAFGMAFHSEDLARIVNEWVLFATTEGTTRRAYDYWILGQGAKVESERWSILRNVLGWSPGTSNR